MSRNAETMGLHIIIGGNPVDGFNFYGPYNNRDEAITAGERIQDIDWWVAPLADLEKS